MFCHLVRELALPLVLAPDLPEGGGNPGGVLRVRRREKRAAEPPLGAGPFPPAVPKGDPSGPWVPQLYLLLHPWSQGVALVLSLLISGFFVRYVAPEFSHHFPALFPRF